MRAGHGPLERASKLFPLVTGATAIGVRPVGYLVLLWEWRPTWRTCFQEIRAPTVCANPKIRRNCHETRELARGDARSVKLVGYAPR